MPDGVRRALRRLVAERGVLLAFAVRSGSRERGVASPDSDLDVTAVHLHEPADHVLGRTSVERLTVGGTPEVEVESFDLNAFVAGGAGLRGDPNALHACASARTYWSHPAAAVEIAALREYGRTAFEPIAYVGKLRSNARGLLSTDGSTNETPVGERLLALDRLLRARVAEVSHVLPPNDVDALCDAALATDDARPTDAPPVADALAAVRRLVDAKRAGRASPDGDPGAPWIESDLARAVAERDLLLGRFDAGELRRRATAVVDPIFVDWYAGAPAYRRFGTDP